MEGWRPTGLDYLAAVTDLLQRERVVGPASGVWEAADFQWWWRKDQHHDPRNQVFWDDASIVITHWGDYFGCELLGRRKSQLLPLAMPRLRELGLPTEMVIRDDDGELIQAALDAGFEPSFEVGVTNVMPAEAVPPPINLPDDVRLLSRAETTERPHHMIPRNGENVAERLSECSIYRPDHDLVLLGLDDEVAGYALFWPDPVTGVGLIEPVRIEKSFQGRGLGKAIMAEGVRRLAEAGCSSMRVTYLVGNQAAKRLYLGTGFQPLFSSTTFTLNH